MGCRVSILERRVKVRRRGVGGMSGEREREREREKEMADSSGN